MEKKAGYLISSSVNDTIFEIILTSELKTDAIEELQNKVADIIDAKGVKNVLVDVRAFIEGASIIETYIFVRRLTTKLKTNIAIVDLPENVDMASLLENKAQNAGRSLRCFTNIDEARTWLKRK